VRFTWQQQNGRLHQLVLEPSKKEGMEAFFLIVRFWEVIKHRL
jgi:hypothetical protein